MKKVLAIISLLIMMIITALGPITAFAEDSSFQSSTHEPRRIINLVYDDSASMYKDFANGKALDTWSKAKYSLEVFAAMLNPNDTMNIYLMSKISGKAAIKLKGSDGAESNIEKINSMKATAADTPFQTVQRACEDLKKAKTKSGDEKWLVVLTDGSLERQRNEKEDPAVINEYFRKMAKHKIRVMFLAMGPQAKGIKQNEDKGIFSESSKKTADILDVMTRSSKRVFNRNSLTVNNDGSFSFDIPMKELVIFAQNKDGDQVTINSVKSGKQTYDPVIIPIQHADKAKAKKELKSSEYYNQFKTIKADEKLSGCIAVVKDDLKEGNYMVDAKGADTIEVYYKPAIAVMASLTADNGKKVKAGSNIKQGNYKIHYNLVKENTNKKINEKSKLLGDNVRYSALIFNGDNQYSTEGQDQNIQLKEGKLDIIARANYLDYNYVETTLSFEARPNDKVITFEPSDSTFTLDKKGLHGDSIKLTATVDGETPSAEEWANMKRPAVQLNKDSDIIKFKVKKSDTPGEYILTPKISETKLKKLGGKNLEGHKYSAALKHKALTKETWTAKANDNTFPLDLEDSRSFLDKYWRTILISALILLLLLLILSETLWKARFSKQMRRSKNPGVKCTPEDYGQDKKWKQAQFEIDFLSKIIPFKAERGTLSRIGKGAPSLSLKAIRGTSNMRLMNAKAFVKKDNVKFDGQRVMEDEVKSFKINPSTRIIIAYKGWKYDCIPCQQRGRK